ncbi:UbiA prenyltransferase family-domain-containing protein [Ochromonadaceae sp. CCMP2298]|nr:UbiA prenyltransferase family-domain-containing protein [Ochromonadaceae sp. CCMP2298]
MGGRKKAPVDHNAPLQKFKAYLELSKFRLSSLVVVTTGAGFICAGQMPIDFPTMAAACVGTFLCAGSASAYNQIIERDIDAKMKRTLMRPLPSGRLGATEGTVLATGMGVAGTAMLYAINPVVAALGFGNILLYAGLYTHTKRTTELNTWIGSLVGAIPPVMGWAAATGGSVLAVEPLALGGLLFLWQFPHFFALSYLHREDYSRGNFQMVACNDPTGMRSADLIMRYSVYLGTCLRIMSRAG